MWQSSISAEGVDEVVLKQIGTKIFPLVDQFGGIVLCDKISDRARLSVAVNDRHAEAVKTELDDAVAYAIGQYYKEKFLRSEINLKDQPDYFQRAFLQALVSFDQNYEREYIKVMLPEAETLSLDGLLRFRCEEIKSRWREIAELAMETAACSVNCQVCLELIKFLVSTLDTVYDRAKIEATESGYCIGFSGRKKERTICVAPEELCAELIRNNPEILVIEEGLRNDREIELAKSIFIDL